MCFPEYCTGRGPTMSRWEGSGCLYRDWLSFFFSTLADTSPTHGLVLQGSQYHRIESYLLAPQSQSIDFELRVLLKKAHCAPLLSQFT